MDAGKTMSNSIRRGKIIKTLWLFSAIMLVGFTNGILGPTVPGLLALTNSPITNMNGLLMGQGLGFICGIISGALSSKRLSPELILSLALFSAAGVNAALPWMRTFPYMAIFVFLQFFLKGIVYNGTMYICGLVWPTNNDVPYQFIVTGLGLGAFVSPFFVFFALRQDSEGPGNQNSTKCHPSTSTFVHNITSTGHSLMPTCANYDMIYLPYLMVALMILPAGVAFAYYAFSEWDDQKGVKPEEKYESLTDITIEKKDLKESPITFWIVMCLLLLFYIPFGGILLSFSHLLASFGIHCRLKISESSMAAMTSLYWFCCLLGRSVNTLISMRVKMFQIICFNFVGFLIANVVLVFYANVNEGALWAGSASLSLFNSVFLPGVMTWIGAYCPLGGLGICLSLIGLAFGELVSPILGGHLFTLYGPMTLIYLTASLAVVQFLIFVILSFIVYCKLK